MGTFIHLYESSDRGIPQEKKAEFVEQLIKLFRKSGIYDREWIQIYDKGFYTLKEPVYENIISRNSIEENRMACMGSYSYFSLDRKGWPEAGYSSDQGIFSDKIGGYFGNAVILAYLLYQRYLPDPSYVQVDWYNDPDPTGDSAGILNWALGTHYKAEPFNIFETGWKVNEFKKNQKYYHTETMLHHLLLRTYTFDRWLAWIQLYGCINGTDEMFEELKKHTVLPENKKPDCIYADEVFLNANNWVDEFVSKCTADPIETVRYLIQFMTWEINNGWMEHIENKLRGKYFSECCFRVPLFVLKKTCELLEVDFEPLLEQYPLLFDLPVADQEAKEFDPEPFFIPDDFHRVPWITDEDQFGTLGTEAKDLLLDLKIKYERNLDREDPSTMKDHMEFLRILQDRYRIYPFYNTVCAMLEHGNKKEVKAYFTSLKDLENSLPDTETKPDQLQAILACAGNPFLCGILFPGFGDQ